MLTRFSFKPLDLRSLREAEGWEAKCDAVRRLFSDARPPGRKPYDPERKYVFRSFGCDPDFYAEQLNATQMKEGIEVFYKARLECFYLPQPDEFETIYRDVGL